MLQRGDSVPHFTVKTVDGDVFEYSSIWQRKNLLLVVLPHAPNNDGAFADLRGRATEFRALETQWVVTRDDVSGLPVPGVLIADRWGEIVHVTSASAAMPTPEELLGWLEYVQNRCPECEGEAK